MGENTQTTRAFAISCTLWERFRHRKAEHHDAESVPGSVLYLPRDHKAR